MPRQSKPPDEVALARASRIYDINREFRDREFDLWGFLNVAWHFCALVERDLLAIGPKMLYIVSADVANCILDPALT